ncbi:Major facilitator superfamily [Macrophomina phaseolina MS6]|uniref:Major facilitator superfamily n=1 Tax=Macrophomina phaseolina (strain MS6) TaxID=1126212 RepID=K2SMH0_MACPH|nr:Major facilitator superfamily [Macrophomina phaseolina MS6]
MPAEKDALQLSNSMGVADNELSHGSSSTTLDPVKEAKMMRKFDMFAVGMLGILYLLANLDRSNIGNAQIAGMPDEIGLTGNQYGNAVTLLYATYVPFELPVAVLLKVIGPKYLLTFCAVAWGLVCLCTGFIQNWQGLYTCRLLIGFFEAGLIPCINVYLGMVYKKSERGKRSSVIFAFSALASAFGGILAYALTQIQTSTYFTSWRALFIFEGAITLLAAPFFYFIFPHEPREAWFLTEEEKEMMRLRYELDPHWGIDEKFSWAAVFSALIDPKWHAFWIFQFSVDVSLYGFTTFLPKIINGLGYSSVKANLLTVPIYFWGLCTFLFTAYMSDKQGVRGYWIAGPLCCLVVGYAILISADSVGVRYFACFVAVMGIYPTTGMSMMWLQDNAAQHFKRATMVGGALTLGNTAGVAVGQIFTTDSAPRYIKGLSIALGLAVVALAMVGGLVVGMARANKRRAERLRKAEEAGAPLASRPEKGDMDVHFVYSL